MEKKDKAKPSFTENEFYKWPIMLPTILWMLVFSTLLYTKYILKIVTSVKVVFWNFLNCIICFWTTKFAIASVEAMKNSRINVLLKSNLSYAWFPVDIY